MESFHGISHCTKLLHLGKDALAEILCPLERIRRSYARVHNRILQLRGLFDKANELVGKAHNQILFHGSWNRRRKRFLRESGIGELSYKSGNGGSDFLLRHVNHGQRLNVYLLAVGFKLNLVTRAVLCLGHNLVLDKEVDVLSVEEVRERVRQGFEVVKAALLSLLYPLVGVVVAVEDNALMLGV